MAKVDHDALFKLLLTAFFREFIELVDPALAADLSLEPLVFLDKESFSDLLDPDRREADLVVQARLRDQGATILVHTEHQAQDDRQIDRRLFRYFARFYDRYDLPVYPIALCSYASPRRPIIDRHQLTVGNRTILDFRYQVLQLNQLDWRDYLNTRNPIAIGLMARMRMRKDERWRVKAACLRLLTGARVSATHQRLLSQFVDIYLPLRGREEQAFQSEVASFAPREQEAVMELVTSWERKGRAEGRAEGQQALVLRQLTRKLGGLPDELRQQVTALPVAQLSPLGEALLDFHSQDDLREWLSAPLHADDEATLED